MENQIHSIDQQVRCDAIVLAGWWLIDCFLQIFPFAARSRLEKCVGMERGETWTEFHGIGRDFANNLLGST